MSLSWLLCTPVLMILVLDFRSCFVDSGLVFALWIYFDFVDLALLLGLTLCLVALPGFRGLALMPWNCLALNSMRVFCLLAKGISGEF